MVSWQVQTGTTETNYVAITNGTSVVSQVTNSSMVVPVLQAQDGSYYGTNPPELPQAPSNVIYHLDQSGNLKWSVPNDNPQIATADGGVIGASGASYDSSGNVTAQNASLPTQSWTGNTYQVGSIDQVASAPLNTAASFWALSGANPSGSSTAAIQEESIYVRSFAPWEFFGAEGLYPLCSNNCFLGDDRSFTTSSAVTARITGIFSFWRSGSGVVVRGPSRAFSDWSHDIWGNSAKAQPRISTSYGPNGYTFHMEFAGSNPLIFPQAASPDINTKLDFTPVWTGGQICYSGHLYGDAFPDAEAFASNSESQRTMLLTFATDGDPNTGPFHYLIGNNNRDMGTFSNVCMTK